VDAKICAQESSVSGDLRKNFEIMLQFGGILTPIMGMKIEIARTVLIAQRVINVIEQKLKVLTTFICQHDSHATPERHWDVAIETSGLGAGKQGRLKRDHASKSESEEIAEGRADGRFGRSIPKHLDLQSPEHGRASVADCCPDSS
jgi:hypothetical protein